VIIAISNQKGGVGKTVLTALLAHRLQRPGRPVLAVDLDPQANLTALLDVATEDGMLTVNDVLADVAHGGDGGLAQATRPAGDAWGAVRVVVADRLLAGREQDVALGRESRLKTALAAARAYEHVLIDCPPALGMLTTNALVAADRAVVVTEPRRSSVDAVAQTVATIAAVRSHYNAGLLLGAVVLNRLERGRRDPQALVAELEHVYGGYVVSPPIPQRESVAAVATSRRPVAGGSPEVIEAVDAVVARLLGGRS